jgi:predicted nucleic acid-binding protein
VKYILDACALIALINEEDGVDVVDDLIKQAQSENADISMSIVNLIEVYYGYIDERGSVQAAELLETILAYPITIIHTITNPVFREASRLKGTYKMSLGDAIGLATAINLKGVFVSSDGELAEPEKREGAPVFWFRPPKK